MTKTYTIAYITESSALLAVVEDGQDAHAAVAEEAAKIGADISADEYTVVSGCTLTNDDEAGDVVFRNPGGCLGDMLGFSYAVKL